jgi:hypothetical protein
MSIFASFPRWLVFGGWFCSHLLLGTVWSAELGQAKVSAILRDVQKTEGSKTEPAAVGDVIAGGGKIITQGQSLAELKFPDGSVIRIGNNSIFSFDPNDRTVRLDRGTALVSTPPKAEGINIVSGGVSGTVSGDPAGKTFMVTAYPAEGGGGKGATTGGFGLMVLQGSSATTVAAPSGSVSIAPGQFALVGGKMDGAPKVLTVDVGQVFRSSPLVNSFPEPLPTKGAILSTAIQQQGSQSSGGLRSTGTLGVALTSGGDLLTGGSKPAKSGGYTFEIASNVPGTGRQEKQATATEKVEDELGIATAAGGPTGGGGIVGAVTGSTGGGSGAGGGGVSVPLIPSTPSNTGQQGITANQNNPNNGGGSGGNVTPQPKPAVVLGASVASKVYDGNQTAAIFGAVAGGISLADSVSLQNDTTGVFVSKNVGNWAVSTSIGLVGLDAGKYVLSQPSLNGTITAKALTMTGSSAASKVYDGNTTASVALGSLSGEVAGETLGATTVVGTFADKNIGTKSVAAVYTLANGSNGELASNYTLAGETLTGTITAKDLSVFSAAVSTKVYDGNDVAVVTGAVLVGNSSTDIDGKFIGTETVTLNGGTAGTFASKNVGAGQGVTTTMSLGGSDAGNYTLLNQPVLTGVITAKGLSITAPSLASKVYDGNRTAGVVSLGTLSGFVGSETVAASGAVADYSSANVGSYSSAIAYTLSNGSNGGLASNYSLAAGSATGVITAKGLSITAPSIASKVYNGNATAGSLTLGALSGFVGSETVTASGIAADYSSANVGTYNGVAVSYTLSNGSNGGLASNYSLAAGSATGVITAKDVTIASGSVSGKVYDGNTGAVVTAGSVSGLVVGENLGTTTAVGTFASKDVGTRNVAASYTLTDGVNLASNYNLLNPTETLSATITAKGLSVTAPSIASKKYDGTTAAGAVTVGTLSGFVGSEIVTAAGSAVNYSSANVGSYSSAVTYTLSDGSNGGLASNYSLAGGSATGAIIAKDLVVNASGITVGKIYDGGTSINPATQVSIGAGVLSGSSNDANDGRYIGTETVTLAVDAAGTFERNLPGTMIPISTTVKLASGNAVNNNYTLRAQPTGLTGEITGTANLDQNGVGISVSSADYIHIRNTTTSRMQDGLSISSATGSVLLENSSFDGWMKRLTPNQTISDGGAFTFTFSETVATAVNSPVLRVKMEANDPANVNINKQFMLLGDYQLLLRHDVDGDPTTSGDTKSATLFSFPGSVNDPSGIGSLAPSVDLVIRDSASTQVKDLPWNTKEYSSLNGSGAAVDSGNYATVQGEFKGDSAASGLDIATSSGGAAGKWDVTVSDPVLVGEGKVTDVRLKYNNNTKALIQGPTGVRLVNVIFEGMDAVEVGAGLNDKVLMSGTLVSDPNIGKMVVKAGQMLEAHFASDATMREVRASADAEILAGVVKDPSSPTGLSFIAGANRVLEMQSATIAGQLSLASHTIVFNNANITSGGVIDARTRDGMVNRTYGSVVPGTVSFMGGNGNIFVNQNNGNPITMRIDNGPVNTVGNAFTQGHLTDVGSGGSGSVMNVGRVR